MKLKSDLFTIFRLIWNQTDIRLVPKQSENGNYNLISVWFNKIPKSFLCVWCARAAYNPVTWQTWFYGVMVSTLDSESNNPSSNLGKTWCFFSSLSLLFFSNLVQNKIISTVCYNRIENSQFISTKKNKSIKG